MPLFNFIKLLREVPLVLSMKNFGFWLEPSKIDNLAYFNLMSKWLTPRQIDNLDFISPSKVISLLNEDKSFFERIYVHFLKASRVKLTPAMQDTPVQQQQACHQTVCHCHAEQRGQQPTPIVDFEFQYRKLSVCLNPFGDVFVKRSDFENILCPINNCEQTFVSSLVEGEEYIKLDVLPVCDVETDEFYNFVTTVIKPKLVELQRSISGPIADEQLGQNNEYVRRKYEQFDRFTLWNPVSVLPPKNIPLIIIESYDGWDLVSHAVFSDGDFYPLDKLGKWGEPLNKLDIKLWGIHPTLWGR